MRRFAGLLLLLTLLLSVAGSGWAQDGEGDTKEKGPGPIAHPVETEAPYSGWKSHAAARPEDAVTLLRYTPPGGESRYATGVVVRCDGFILVPRIVWDTAKEGGTVEAVLPSTEGSKAEKPVPISGRLHMSLSSIDFNLIKATGYHVRCLPLMQASNVKQEGTVRLLMAAPKEGNALTITSYKARIGAQQSDKDYFALTDILPEKGSPGDAAPALPVGTLVIDEKSGGVLGMVTAGQPQPLFTTFAKFHSLSQDIGLAPTREAVRLGDLSVAAGTVGEDGMVWIPGGPIRLEGKVGADYQRIYKTNVVCIPGFYIDVFLVTCKDYREWLLTTNARRLPTAWDVQQELRQPKRRPDFPVTGMFGMDAADYALEHKKRLVTDIEWRRASYGADISWYQELVARWDAAADYLGKILLRRGQRREEAIALRRLNKERVSSNSGYRSPEDEADFWEQHNYLREFLRDGYYPNQIVPVGWYEKDISMYGVRDVVTNVPELVQYTGTGTPHAAKPFPTTRDPLLTTFTWTGNSEEARASLFDIFFVLFWQVTHGTGSGSLGWYDGRGGADPGGYSWEWITRCPAGFRGAR
jgi:formylglycine-generating enzyme required for sulfatase activity